jgi:ISXO2-like transposase domain
VSLVATDENPTYDYLRRGIRHEAVKHFQGEYVRGEVHTNNIESFWMEKFKKALKPLMPIIALMKKKEEKKTGDQS